MYVGGRIYVGAGSEYSREGIMLLFLTLAESLLTRQSQMSKKSLVLRHFAKLSEFNFLTVLAIFIKRSVSLKVPKFTEIQI